MTILWMLGVFFAILVGGIFGAAGIHTRF